MYNEGFEQWFKMNKNLATPMNEWNKITSDICQRTSEQQLEILSENISRFSDQLKRMSNIKKPEDFVNLQRDFLGEDMTATIEATQKSIHTLLENMEEFTKACGTACQTATETTKEAKAATDKKSPGYYKSEK